MTPDPRQIADDLRGQFRGRLHYDALTRGLYATDASPFHVLPLAVAVPADAADVASVVRYCFEHNLPLIPRGAGTGLAGESLGPAVVLDLSVHLRAVQQIDGETVTVEPGVTCAALNAALARHGRRFAPDPASAATCTIGGMVATDASGGNAFRYGYTRDYVVGLEVVWDDGEAVRLPAADPPPRTAELLRGTTELLAAQADVIRSCRPRTPYDRCGYRLHDVGTPAGVDLARLLVGSEGTLGVITAVTLRTLPLPGGMALMLLGFPTLDAAVRAGLDLRSWPVVACDLLDQRLLTLARRVGAAEGLGIIPPAVGAALFITVEGDTERQAIRLASDLLGQLRQAHLLRVLAEPTCSPEGVGRVRRLREAGVGGLYGLGGGPRPLAFIEDVGIPADALPEFLGGVRAVLRRHDVTASFLIHVLTGQVHTRPLLNLDDPADRAKLWPLAEAVHTLALGLGGTVSTQHGTGLARTPWVERQYGPLYRVFRELKRIFDPKNILNPGKIVGPDPSREAWPLRPVAGPAGPAPPASRGLAPRVPLLVWRESSPWAEAAKCSGCGDCRVAQAPQRMCPIFRVTGVEAATPRAKANLVRLLTDPEAATAEEVRDVAALCVHCLMCRDECDARVDVPKLMLEVKSALHAELGPDRADWFLAKVPALAAVGSHFAPFVNTLLAWPAVRWVLEKLTGVSRWRRLPAFALRNFFRRARGRGLDRRRPAAPDRRRIAYFVDTFAAYNDPLVGDAVVAVLRHQGFEVYVPPRQTHSGMAALVIGDLEAAREVAAHNVRVLADLVRDGYRVICSEPTAAVMLTRYYPDLLGDGDAAAVAAHTSELTAFLGELHAAGRLRTDFRPLDLTVGHHIPCHIRALGRPAAGPLLLALIPGLRVRTIDVGCSGMAGIWGLKAAHFATSLAVGAPVFAALDRPGVLFGSTECAACRIQLQQGTGKRTLHVVQYLAYAYGLLPEVEERLKRPLGKLVSD